MENKGYSLSAQTFKYWEIFLSWVFKYPSRCFALNQQKESYTFANQSDELYRFALRRGHEYGNMKRNRESTDLSCEVIFHDMSKLVSVNHFLG